MRLKDMKRYEIRNLQDSEHEKNIERMGFL